MTAPSAPQPTIQLHDVHVVHRLRSGACCAPTRSARSTA